MTRWTLTTAAALTLVLACTPSEATATGIVIGIDSAQLGGVQGFTLRTDTGETIDFKVDGPVALDGDSFPPDHLREHLAAVEPIRVTYEPRDGMRIVLRLTDAP